ELLDMFAPQELFLTEGGSITVSVMIPYVQQHSSNTYFANALSKTSLSLKKLIADSDKYKALFILLSPDSNKSELNERLKDCLLLSETSFLKLHKIAAREKKCPDLFNFITTHIIDAHFIPQLSEFLKRNPNFTDRMSANGIRYADVGIHEYLQMMY